MAAGRHGGYRDNEFKGRESEFKLSGREYDYSKEEYDQVRITSNHEVRIRDARDRVRVRQKDIKEREAMNGEYHSSSSRSDSGSTSGQPAGPKRCGFSASDREPGELSSESGSHDAIEWGSQVQGNEATKVENGTLLPLQKKRKFSPIVWDREDKAVGNNSRSASTATTFPPPPLLPKSFCQSPNLVPDGGVRISPIKYSKLHNLEPSPVKILVPAAESVGNNLSDSPLELCSLAPLEQQRGNDQEFEQLEHEDFVSTRNIASSRWADEAKSPRDEDEISDDEEMRKRRKKMPIYESLEMRVRIKSRSPELRDANREGSEGANVKKELLIISRSIEYMYDHPKHQ